MSQPQHLPWNVVSTPLCNYHWAGLLCTVIGQQRVETLAAANSRLCLTPSDEQGRCQLLEKLRSWSEGRGKLF